MSLSLITERGVAELRPLYRDAALRELIEETGYGGDGEGAGTATVEDVSPLLVSIPSSWQ